MKENRKWGEEKEMEKNPDDFKNSEHWKWSEMNERNI